MSKKGGFLSGALFGAIVATGAALLFSPKSGKELREDLKKHVDDFKESDGDYLGVAKEKKEIAVEKALEKKEEWQEKLQVHKENFTDKASDLQEKLSEKTNGKSEDALVLLKDKKEELMNRLKKDVKTTGFDEEEENIFLELPEEFSGETEE